MKKYVAFTASLLALSACSTDTNQPVAPDFAAPAFSRDSRNDRENDRDDDDRGYEGEGAVYTLSNQTGGNKVLAFRRAPNGHLIAADEFPTGGTGSGGGLGNQGALSFTQDGRFMLAVNPGSNDISVFRMNGRGLILTDRQSSGGQLPISITGARGLVYVLNGGGNGNIAGFRLSASGKLSPIAGSMQSLSSSASGPAQIEFDETGRRLVVTEKATNIIGVYRVDEWGRASAGVFTPSVGQTPFGFAIRNNVVLVSEAVGGAPDASVASSYRLGAQGSLAVISGAVPTTETAACWFVVTKNGRFGYVSNTGGGTITGYRISPIGRLQRLDADGETAVIGSGSGPIDMALSENSRFLYILNSGTETISVARVRADGSLKVLDGGFAGLPNGANGLLAR